MDPDVSCGDRSTSLCGVKDENGYYIKALPNGEPWPKDFRIAKDFKAAGVDTLPAAFKYAVDKNASKECMATRMLLSRHHEEVSGKTMEKLHFGEYFWRTYSEVQESIQAVGCSLVNMNYKAGDRVGILAETRAEWFIAAMGCLQQRIAICTIYTTLGDEAIIHALNEIEVNTIFISFDLVHRLGQIIHRTPKLTTIVVIEDQLDGMGNTSVFPNNLTVIPFSRLSAKKNINKETLQTTAQPDDVAIIMYTSGSTGNPKGVELTHSNIITAIVGFNCQMNLTNKDRYLAYLPLAHIMEFGSEIIMICLGVTIYYSSPYTLTSSSPKIKAGTDGDAKIARPTLLVAVPLMLDRIIKGVSQAVENQGWLKSILFNFLVSYNVYIGKLPFLSNILDRLVFQKVRDELGGALKSVAVGGAPVSPLTHMNFMTIFGCTVQVGYGSTETTGCSTGMNVDDNKTGVTGGPSLNVLLKLTNWEDGNYRITDRPFPRGEILIGGPCVAKGYFKLPNETNKSFFKEDGVRWFRTGDIAEMDDTGCIRIIDRKKDIVKLKHGEYISLGNAESIIKTHNVVDNMCVFADSSKDKPVAVIVPTLTVLQKIAYNCGIGDSNLSLKELCDNELVIAAVLKELQHHGKRCGLSRWEIPAAVHLTTELWTPDTGLVTAALKIRRKPICDHYKSMVIDMYSQLED